MSTTRITGHDRGGATNRASGRGEGSQGYGQDVVQRSVRHGVCVTKVSREGERAEEGWPPDATRQHYAAAAHLWDLQLDEIRELLTLVAVGGGAVGRSGGCGGHGGGIGDGLRSDAVGGGLGSRDEVAHRAIHGGGLVVKVLCLPEREEGEVAGVADAAEVGLRLGGERKQHRFLPQPLDVLCRVRVCELHIGRHTLQQKS